MSSFQIDVVRAKNHPKVVDALQQWVAGTDVAAIEDVTVHQASSHIVYTIFYWEEGR